MTFKSKSSYGVYTFWFNDQTDTPPTDTDNYWLFRCNLGIGMISKTESSKDEAGNVAATLLLCEYQDRDITLFEFIDSVN